MNESLELSPFLKRRSASRQRADRWVDVGNQIETKSLMELKEIL